MNNEFISGQSSPWDVLQVLVNPPWVTHSTRHNPQHVTWNQPSAFCHIGIYSDAEMSVCCCFFLHFYVDLIKNCTNLTCMFYEYILYRNRTMGREVPKKAPWRLHRSVEEHNGGENSSTLFLLMMLWIRWGGVWPLKKEQAAHFAKVAYLWLKSFSCFSV